VSVSVWSSEMDHSLESVIVFQSQSRERTDAYIHVYDDDSCSADCPDLTCSGPVRGSIPRLQPPVGLQSRRPRWIKKRIP
jgi:hypothetical protein